MPKEELHLTIVDNTTIGNGECSFRISMLPASHGDCLFVELKNDTGEWYSILIDCGVFATWNNGLKQLKESLIMQGREIDLLILTHIDEDHIGGCIPLLKDEANAPFVREVWFNGLRQLLPEPHRDATYAQNELYRKIAAEHRTTLFPPGEKISVEQALSVEEMIIEAGIPLNQCNNGGAVVAGLQTINVTPDIKLDILLPTDSALQALLSRFRTEIKKLKMREEAALSPECMRALEHVLLDEQDKLVYSSSISQTLLDITNLENWGKAIPQDDSSSTNRSSIAFCLRICDHAMLFPGDAAAKDLLPALREWRKKTGHSLCFDLIKLPHHGAFGNNCALFDEVDAKAFLISTDGTWYQHPDKETLARIVARPTEVQRLLVFNYENEAYRLFSNPSLEKKYHYCVTH